MTEIKTSDKKVTHLDDILVKFSLYGRYHLVFMALIFLLNMFNNMSCVNYVFVVENVRYRCKDERFINNTCTSLSNSTEVCSEWVYENPNSFVAEFQLACQDWKTSLVGTVHNFGYAIGLVIVGPLSDRFGRKKVIIMTSIFGAIFGVARSFTSGYWIYIVLEFLEGALGDVFSPCFILLMEMVARDKRVICKMFSSFGISLSYITLPLSAWLFPYWRSLLRILYGPMIVIFFYIFLLDESPRWLLSKGEKDKAVAVLQKAAKRNNIEIEKTLLDNICYEENKGVKFSELVKCTFSSRLLVKRFLMCIIWWTACTFIVYGVNINAVLLPGNKYINYGLMSVVHLPGKIMISLILIRFRRRSPFIFSFLLGAIFFTIQPFIPQHLPWLSVTLFMAGKLITSFFMTITNIFTSEIFPTITRNSMHALCSALGRVGGVTAPMTPLLKQYWDGLPSIAFALVALTAGLVTFAAPDTADESLPDTVRQAEALDYKHAATTKDDNTLTPRAFKKCCTHL